MLRVLSFVNNDVNTNNNHYYHYSSTICDYQFIRWL
jgi:hypothetical protein